MKRLGFSLLFIFSISAVFAFGQQNQVSADNCGRKLMIQLYNKDCRNALVIPNVYRTFTLDKTVLQNLLGKLRWNSRSGEK